MVATNLRLGSSSTSTGRLPSVSLLFTGSLLQYYVFFKAKDKDQLQPAFKEFTAMTLGREKVKAKDREVAR